MILPCQATSRLFLSVAHAVTVLIGGYGAAIIASAVVASVLPVPRDQAVLAGQMASFAVYSAVVLLGWTTRSIRRVLVLILMIVVLAGVALLLNLRLGNPL